MPLTLEGWYAIAIEGALIPWSSCSGSSRVVPIIFIVIVIFIIPIPISILLLLLVIVILAIIIIILVIVVIVIIHQAIFMGRFEF
jgi:hypothetical protein